MSPRALAVVVFVCGCANAGNGGTGPGDDTEPRIDAPAGNHDDAHVAPADTPPPIDAPGPIDAFVAIDAPVDSGGTGGPFCTFNSDCGAGDCCFDFGQGMGGLCTAGSVDPIFMLCIPE